MSFPNEISDSFINDNFPFIDAALLEGSADLSFNPANLFSSQELVDYQNGLEVRTLTPSPEPNDTKSFHQYIPMLNAEQGNNVEEQLPFKEEQMQSVEDTQNMAPCDVDYPGSLDFKINIHSPPNGSSKTTGLYSEALDKVFINLNQTLTVNFQWTPFVEKLYVRAMMLYVDAKDAAFPVIRCPSHRINTNNAGSVHISHHVMRCQNTSAQYFGEADAVPEQHMSVRVPLGRPQTGADSVRVNYEFACKNSCNSGMNRRCVQCVFTLEDESGQILGRRKVQVRICSCPKRDKEKEEKEKDSEKKVVVHQPPPGKRKMGMPSGIPKKSRPNNNEPINTEVFTIPITIVGSHNVVSMLNTVHGLMASDMVREQNVNQAVYEPHLAVIENLLTEMRKKLSNNK